MMSPRKKMTGRNMSLCLIGLALSGLACVVVVPSGGSSTPATVRVRLINLTGYAVDPEFHANGGPISDAGQLFAAEHKISTFGVGSTGLISAVPVPGFDTRSVEVELPCADARYIGTSAARFIDTSGVEIGRAGQVVLVNRRVDLGGDFDCGSTVQFIYSSNTSNGEVIGFEVDYCVDSACR